MNAGEKLEIKMRHRRGVDNVQTFDESHCLHACSLHSFLFIALHSCDCLRNAMLCVCGCVWVLKRELLDYVLILHPFFPLEKCSSVGLMPFFIIANMRSF